MLDIALVENVVLDLAAEGRVENLFLDRHVNLELVANLPRELLLAIGIARLFELFEQVLDGTVIRLQKRDRVSVLLVGHGNSPVFRRTRSTPAHMAANAPGTRGVPARAAPLISINRIPAGGGRRG
jgi:hypothetical protein